MKGSVTVKAVYSNGTEKILAQESNLIVNGGGEAIAEMMSVPSSTLSYAPEVLDASNWNFAAITFGPAKDSFGQPTYSQASCADGSVEFLGANASYVTTDAIETSTSWINVAPTQRIMRVYKNSLGDTSSYVPLHKLPSYPDPLDTDLEPNAEYQYVSVSGDGQTFYGHHENRIHFAPDDASSYCIGAFGGYGATSTTRWDVYLVSSLDGDFETNPDLNYIASAPAGGFGVHYNSPSRSRLDKHGFLAIRHADIDGWNNTQTGVGYFEGTESTSSLQITDGYVEITTLVSPFDVLAMNAYGGIHHLGLWVYDNKECLKNTTAPYSLTPDSNGDTGLRYKLFAKKTFSEDLTYHADNGTAAGIASLGKLTITWRIDFRS